MIRIAAVAVGVVVGVAVAPVAGQNAPSTPEPARPQISPPVERATAEVFPGVRVDPERRIVEFDGFVAIDCHHPETPDVYLEVIACSIDSREHESLVATAVRGSHVHAALLAIGAEPGRPGGWKESGQAVRPTGGRVVVELLVPGKPDLPTDPRDWIRSIEREQSLAAWDKRQDDEAYWVFAGSIMRETREGEVYAADGTGQIVGLHTFGSEVVAWSRVLSPEAALLEPEWLADPAVVPVIKTPVTVRLSLQNDEDDQPPEPATEDRAGSAPAGRPPRSP